MAGPLGLLSAGLAEAPTEDEEDVDGGSGSGTTEVEEDVNGGPPGGAAGGFNSVHHQG
jgi:hypothetical protein